jgi:hypothetical protein
MLCALAFSAFAAQGAAAASNGTTAFTCVKGGGKVDLKGEHCLTTGPLSNEYGHVEVPPGVATEINITNKKTGAEEPSTQILKETIGGIETELRATGLTGIGTQTNSKDATTGEHFISGTAFLEYTGVTVAKPAGKGCKVFTDNPVTKVKGAEGVIDAHLDLTTKGQEDSIKFTPAASTAGAPFASFFIEGCSPAVPAIEGTWEVVGSATCKPTGATIVCSHSEITTQNTLKGKGAKAGFEGSVTIKGRANEGEPFTPLSNTTVATP